MKIRKQIYELTLHDLEKYPIWEFALDEEGQEDQDEATVRPRPDLSVADPNKGMFVVKTEFIANDRSIFYGYCSPQEEYDLGSIQPVVVTDSGQVMFWYGTLKPKDDEIEQCYKKLNKNKDSLFPLRFRAITFTKGAKLEGIISAFLYLEDDDKVKEIT